MATTRRKTDDVLAAARKELQGQLAVVREDLDWLTAEESVLTLALSSLDGNDASPSAKTTSNPNGTSRTTTPRSTGGGRTRRRRRRGASKSTADRVEELQGVLADGPKSRTDLAAALKVSPARVQQLLAELGGSVRSQADPGDRRGKLWALKGASNGTRAAKPASRRSSGTAKRAPARRSGRKR